MDQKTAEVRDFYDSSVEHEWDRVAGRPEFLLTCRMLDRYIHPGDKVLDIGGGPGRYSLYLAAKGCDVMLLDLSPRNTEFAAAKAAESGLPLSVVAGDARQTPELVTGLFDHVLLMGPLYHLQDETDRTAAVQASLDVLKPGGVLFASFINLFSGMVWNMKNAPEAVLSADPVEVAYFKAMVENRSFAEKTFTYAYFIAKDEVLPFMARFPLDKLHFFGQESILWPCEANIMAQPQPVIDAWLDLCEQLWERDDLLNFAEHLIYVGRKR